MEVSKEIKDAKPIEDSPSRSTDLSKTLPEEALNNFLQGKRHILVQDYFSAVHSLSLACEVYTQHFGEMAIECAELHFLYGKALFRLSQQQSGVLGDVLNTDVDDEEGDEDGSSEEESKENEESEKNDSDTENGEKQESDVGEEKEEEKEPSESTDSPQPIVEEPQKDVPEGDQNASEADTTLPSTEKADEEQNEAEEGDLEVAWNSLETAKSIFLRQGKDNVEVQLKVAEILQLLAEISMECDNNITAITDLKECLSIKKLHLKPDDRILAETYYQMGLAQMLEKMYFDALENFTTTVDILQLRINNLKNTPIQDEPGSFERADCEKEIEELEGVLADIKEKIDDTKELIEEAKKTVEERIATKAVAATKDTFPDSEPFPSSTEKKPVSNITHLLKRKKPDQDDDKERETKRSKLSPTIQNGAIAE